MNGVGTNAAILLIFLVGGSLGTHFRFGIITWKPDATTTNKVWFQFKLAWRRSYNGYHCDSSTISSNRLIGSGSWNCASGCSGTISSAQYYCTSYSTTEDWSQGERTVEYTFSGTGPFTIRFSSCCWISSLIQGADGSWSVETEVNLRRRSDNGKINSSPISATSPIIRLQLGCSYSIPVHTDDVDGDVVKCRWGSGSECGGVCNALTGATLTSNPCVINYKASTSGWHAVALMLEDFISSSSSSVPLSKVPLQFLLNVAQRGTGCATGLKFTSSTLTDNVCVTVPSGTSFTTKISVTEQGSSTLKEVTIVAPQGMSQSSIRGTSPNKYADITWRPTIQQHGSHVFCFTALDNLGVATSQRCVTIVAGFSSPAIIPNSHVPAKNSIVSPVTQAIFVDFNQNVRRPLTATAVKIYTSTSPPTLIASVDTATSSLVSVVNQTLTVSLPASVSLLPEQTYYITMETGAVRGLHSCTGGGTPSPAITSSSVWNFTTAPVYCPPIECPPYGRISTSVRKYNTMVTFSCAKGYTLSSSSSRSCQLDSTWTGSTPTCTIMDCGSLSTPSNGVKYGSLTTFGSVVTFTCNTGYKLTGSTARSCQNSSSWSGSQPVCSVVNCETLSTPTNGKKVGSSTVYGQSIAFSCLNGYSLSGSTTRTCQADGMWSGTQPTCHAKGCGNLSAPMNGKISCGSGDTYGVTTTFECNAGYKITSGSVSRSCVVSSSGSVYWSGSQPVCTIMDCGKLGSPVHGAKSGTSTTYGATITFTCSPGYRLSGSSTRTCRADGTWGGNQPTCEIQRCTALASPNYGRVSKATQIYDVTLAFDCYRGYKLTAGSSSRTCAAVTDGSVQWTGSETACTIVDCGALPTPASGFRVQNLTTYEASVSFSCATGYKLIGSSRRRCGADGNWDGTQPTCQIVDCGSLDAPEYGMKTGLATAFRSVVYFSCVTGYKLLGSNSRTCQSDGSWAGKQPICRLVDCGVLTIPLKGSLSGQGTDYNSSVSFTCNSGHSMTGSPLRICQSDGTWSGLQPICEIRYCADPGLPTNGSRSSHHRIYGSVISFSCHDTFTLVGNRTIECIETSIDPVEVAWTAPIPTCDIIPALKLIEMNASDTEHNDLPSAVYSPAIDSDDDPLTIDCLAVKGQPIPDMMWTVDDQTISHSNSSDVYERQVTTSGSRISQQLVIQRFHFKQEGNYTCWSRNRAGSAQLSFTLLLQVPPADPVITSVKVLNSTSVLVSWHVPRFDGNSLVTGYAIEYRDIWGGLWQQAVKGNVAASVHLFIVNGLHPFTVYEFRVRARNKIGYGNYSSTSARMKTIQTAPSQPREVTVVAGSAYSIQVSWSEPDPANGVITGYRITYTDESFPATTSDTSTIKLNGSVHTTIIDGLKPYRRYGVIVQAKTEEPPANALWGTVSTHTRGITLTSRPTSPPAEVVAASGTTNILVSWKAPAAQDFNGIVLGYRIEYSSSTSSNSHSILVGNGTFVFNLTDLAPYTTYTIQVYLKNPSGESPASDTVVLKTGEAPPTSAPYQISVRAISSTSIEVSWSSLRPHHIPGVLDGFDIYFTDEQDHEHHQGVYGPNATSTVLTNLAVFSTYSITVAARTGGGIGPRGPSFPLVVQTMEDMPSSPAGGISVISLSSTSTRVSWGIPAIPNGIITGYVVFYWNSSFSGNITIANVSLHQWIITGLNEFTDYSVAVAAVTGGGIGNLTVAEVSKTFEAVPSRPPVVGSVTEVLSDRMVVSWQPPTSLSQNGIIITYEVRYNSSQFGVFEKYVNVSASSDHITLVGLQEYATYDIQVRAYTAVGPGPFSTPIQIRTLAAPSDPPTIVKSYASSSTSVFLDWQPPSPDAINGALLRYEVVFWEPSQMALGSAGSAMNVESADPGPGVATSFTVQGLEKYTIYEVKVRIVTAGNIPREELYGSWSRSVTIQTAEDLPGAPVNFTTTSLFAHGATLSWKQPMEPNGIILGFMITTVTADYKLAQPVEARSSLGLSISDNNTVALPSSHLSFQLTNLHAYSEYHVKIQAQTSVGLGISSWLLLETPQTTPSGPVRNLVATTEPTASHTAAINVSWVPPVLDDRNGVLTGYRVTYYPTDGTAPSNVLYVSYDDLNSNDGQERERSMLITHLDGHRPYDVIVSACIDVDDGKACGPETAVFVHTLETIPEAGPGTVDIIALSPSMVLVNWTAPTEDDKNGALTGYTVYVRYYKDGNHKVLVTEEHTLPPNATSYVINGLDGTHHYIVGITAATIAGEGSVSSASTDFTTDVHECNVSNSCGVSEECYQSVKGHDVCLCPESSTSAGCLRAPEAVFRKGSESSSDLIIYIGSGVGGALLLIFLVAVISGCYFKRRGKRSGGFAPDDDNDEQMDYGELPPTSETMSGFPGFGASAMGRLPMGQFAIANPVYDQFVNEDDQTIEEAGL